MPINTMTLTPEQQALAKQMTDDDRKRAMAQYGIAADDSSPLGKPFPQSALGPPDANGLRQSMSQMPPAQQQAMMQATAPSTPDVAAYNPAQSDVRPDANPYMPAMAKAPAGSPLLQAMKGYTPQQQDALAAIPRPAAGQTVSGEFRLSPEQMSLLGMKAPVPAAGNGGSPFDAALSRLSPGGMSGILNPDLAPLAEVSARSALAQQTEQRLREHGTAQIGIEHEKLAKLNDPRTILALAAQRRIEQGVPMTPTDMEIELQQLNKIFGAPESAGGKGPLSQALANPAPPIAMPSSTADRLKQIPGGLDVVGLREGLAKVPEGNNFGNFLQGVIKSQGDQWVDKNFPMLQEYSNEQFPGGISGLVNPGAVSQGLNWLGGRPGPGIGIGEILRSTVGSPSSEDLTRAKLRDVLIRSGQWDPTKSKLYKP